MVDYYPVFLDLKLRRVVLVGGGHVALEKIGKLVEAGADVTVIAPGLIPAVRAFVDEGRAKLIERPYRTGDVEGATLVLVATDDGAINRQVADEARSLGILVNAADDAHNCDFILPSLATRGRIAIASSTGGASPALARWLRERMEEFLAPEVEALADVLAEVRVLARARDRACAARCERAATPPPLLCPDCPNRIHPDRWQEAIDDELMALLRDGRVETARERLVDALGIDGPLRAPAMEGARS